MRRASQPPKKSSWTDYLFYAPLGLMYYLLAVTGLFEAIKITQLFWEKL